MVIDNLLEDVRTVYITGHVSPDGDCVGSNLALYNYIALNYPDIDVKVFLEPPTDKLAFLKGFDDLITDYQDMPQCDLMFCIDCASEERLGKAGKYFKPAAKTVNIDHHISNTLFAGENIVKADASSACEVLYGLIDNTKIDRDIAICLYTGIVYDTGVFKYSSTSPDTMVIAADLMRYDIPTQFIIDESFYSKTYNENRIYGYAIFRSVLCYNDKVIYSYITKEKMKMFHVTKQELEGIVSQMLLTKGVECSIFIYDLDEKTCKVSFRSAAYLDVNKIAQKFGGGGHTRASGCTINGSVNECIIKVLEEVGKYI